MRYEYTPGFDEIKTLTRGGQGHYWLNDHVKVGLTGEHQRRRGRQRQYSGADLTLRKSADSWFKVQSAKSEGLVSSSLYSDDGGFGFAGSDPLAFDDAEARGVSRGSQRRVRRFHRQESRSPDAVLAEPGRRLLGAGLRHAHRPEALRRHVPDADRRAPERDARRPISKIQDQGLQTSAQELNVRYQLTDAGA